MGDLAHALKLETMSTLGSVGLIKDAYFKVGSCAILITLFQKLRAWS
jgi:hypothetical protein